MTYELVVQLARQGVLTAFLLSAPMLSVALAAGLTVGILQTVTQVQEQTVAFVVKLFAAGLVLFALMPWMLSVAVTFAAQIVRSIPVMISY